MKIAAISTTKNECDVIESFVRHNSRFCEKFFFVDESEDATREILGNLQKEGFDLAVFSSNSNNYQQRQLIYSVMQHIASLNEYDWILLLDADEIISDITREDFEYCLKNIPDDSLALIPWQTFIPKTVDYFTFQDPLTENFLPRITEGTGVRYHKIFVPRNLFPVAIVAPGNHYAFHSGTNTRLPESKLPFNLGHFPVRSPDQIVIKNIIATHNLSMKTDRLSGEGAHVYNTLEHLRSRRFQIAYSDLKQLASNYAAIGSPDELDIDLNGSPIRKQAEPLRYGNLFKRNVVQALDLELERLAKQIMHYKGTISATKTLLTAAGVSNSEAIAALTTADNKFT